MTEEFNEIEGFDPLSKFNFSDINPLPAISRAGTDAYKWIAESSPVRGIKRIGTDVYDAAGEITRKDFYASDKKDDILRASMQGSGLNNAIDMIGQHQNKIFRGYNNIISNTSGTNTINFNTIVLLILLVVILFVLKYFWKK
jgi:hypothetical protein